jgi:fructokinase
MLWWRPRPWLVTDEERFMSFKVIGLGEVLWDLLPGGRQLGGAPANFAYHAGALGAEAQIISRVGNDPLGREALNQLAGLGIPTDCVEVDDSLPTGTVSVEVASDGQPHYQIHEHVAWEALRGEAVSRRAVAGADAVCFGSLAQRRESSRSTIRALVAAAPASALRIFDINLRQHYYSREVIEESLARANVLKVNDTELPRLAEMFQLAGDVRSQILQLGQRHRLHGVAYTRGGNGSLLYSEGRWSDHPGIPTKVVDTVGAGDSFTAAMTLGLLAGWDLDRVNEHANQLAAYVCSHPGGMPRLSASFREAFAPAATVATPQ